MFGVLAKPIQGFEAPRSIVLTVMVLLALPATTGAETMSGWVVAVRMGDPTFEADYRSRASLEAISMRLAGHMPLGRRVDLYGFVGPIEWSLDIERLSYPDVGPLSGLEDSGTDACVGAGVGVTIGKGFSGFIEYEHVAYDRFVLDASPWLGLRWRS